MEMNYEPRNEEYWNDNLEIVNLPKNDSEFIKFILAHSIVAPGIEKISPQLFVIDLLMSLRRHKVNGEEYHPAKAYYGERWNKVREHIISLRESVADLDFMIRGLRDRTILSSEIKTPRYFEWMKQHRKVIMFNPLISHVMILLLHGTNINEEPIESHHYTVSGHTMRELKLVIKEKEKNKQEEDEVDKNDFDEDGMQMNDEFFQDNYI